MIFAREVNDSLTSLVKKIDAETAKNKGAKMGSFVVFLSEDEKLQDKLKELATKEGIKNTIFSIDNPAGPNGYEVAKDADVTVVSPVIHENRYGTLGTDLPDRFLLWGVFRLPLKFQVAPVIEYRNGFPYVRTNAAQQYDGIPNSTRYPHFLSIDSRFSKDLQVSPKYSVRLSLTAFNFTDHFNPEQVHHNTADPACGYFFGHRGRRFTADFDFLF